MKPLSQHIQESLNEESKNIFDIASGNRENNLGLSESNSEKTVVEEVAKEEEEEVTNENVVTKEATEKEKPSDYSDGF